jgi:hypothetical protein
MLRYFAFALLLGSLGVASGQMPDARRDFVLTEKDAVGMLAPRVVCAAYAETMKWSSDGSLLLVSRIDSSSVEAMTQLALSGQATSELPALTRELVFYSVKGNKIKTAVPLTGRGVNIRQIEWLPQSSQVALLYTHPVFGADGSVDAYETVAAMVYSDGRVRPLAKSTDPVGVELVVNPNGPSAAVIQSSLTLPEPGSGRSAVIRRFLQFVGASGPVGAAVELPGTYSDFVWGPDGNPYVCSRKVNPAKKRVETTWFRVDRSTGKMAQTEAPNISPPAPRRAGVNGLMASSFEFKPRLPKEAGEALPPVQSIGLFTVPKSGQSAPDSIAFVSSDGVQGEISPAGDYVAYVHHGVAMVRPLIHIPKEIFLEALAKAKRIEALNNAKQVGLALIMFASDNDDKLPGADANWSDSVNPYLRDASLLNGFVFSLSGTDLSKVDKPSETEMGYVPGPGGRAVVYADGHAKWVPTGKP